MKSMFLAAAAVLGIGIGTAYAGDGDEPLVNTYFTELPGIVAQRQVGIGTASDGISYVTRSLPNPTGQISYGPRTVPSVVATLSSV